MKVISGSESIKKTFSYPIVTLGNFDGVHKGHTKIINKAIQLSKKNNGTSIVYTFTPHPVTLLAPDVAPKQLQTDSQKTEVLEQLGIDVLVLEPFTKKLAKMSAKVFFEEIIINRLGAKVILVGYDFTFGQHRSGTAEELELLAKKHNITVHIIPAIFLKESLLSSTHIRHFIEDGNIQKANEMIGRPYIIDGKVIKGRGIGAEVGYHTANISTTNELLPPPGVYITRTTIVKAGKTFMSATNIGYNPTFGGNPLSIETHLIDFTGNLRGKEIKVEFLSKIRREVTFESIDALRNQIESDIEKTRKYYAKKRISI